MPDERHLTPEDELALVELVDGSLDPERRAALEARAESDPALARAIDDQRYVAATIASAVAETYAPHSLRLELESARERAARARPRRRWWGFAGLATAGAAAAAIVVLVIGGGTGLTLTEAAQAATREPTGPAPPGAPGDRLLDVALEGVPFPDYAEKFGWRATGQRADEQDGRTIRTVFYEKGGRRLAYSIVSGDPLDVDASGGGKGEGGRRIDLADADGRQVAVFTRGEPHLRAVGHQRARADRARQLDGQGQRQLLSFSATLPRPR